MYGMLIEYVIDRALYAVGYTQPSLVCVTLMIYRNTSLDS